MKIRELVKKLKSFDQDLEIFQSIDPEGNEIRVIFNVAMYEIGDLVPCEKSVLGSVQVRKGEYFKWVVKRRVPVIWPTDEIISN